MTSTIDKNRYKFYLYKRFFPIYFHPIDIYDSSVISRFEICKRWISFFVSFFKYSQYEEHLFPSQSHTYL